MEGVLLFKVVSVCLSPPPYDMMPACATTRSTRIPGQYRSIPTLLLFKFSSHISILSELTRATTQPRYSGNLCAFVNTQGETERHVTKQSTNVERGPCVVAYSGVDHEWMHNLYWVGTAKGLVLTPDSESSMCPFVTSVNP